MNIAPGRTGGSSGDDDDTSSGGSSSSRSSPPDDIQRVDPGAPSGGSSPTTSTTVDSIPGSGASIGGDDISAGIGTLRQNVSDGVDRVTTPEDTSLQAPEGSSGDIDFRLSERLDRIGDGSDIRTDTTGRQISRTIGQRGAAAGASVGVGAADRIGAGESEQRLGGALGGLVGGLPGAIGTIGADAADTARFVGSPVTGRVERGAQLGAGDISDAFVETGQRTVETGTTVADAGIAGVDRRFDIDFDRRDRGDGAAVQFTDDPETRSQLGAELTFGAFTLGASPAAGAGVRGAATRTRSVDTDSLSDFIAADRGQADLTGRQRSRSDRDADTSGDTTTIGAEDLDPGNLDFNPATGRPPERMSPTDTRGGVVRGDDIDPAGAVQRRRDQLQRGDRVVDDRSRDLAFESALSDGAQSTTSAAGGSGVGGSGAGGASFGTLAAANDPTGISQTGTAGAGSPQDPARIQGGGATVGDLDAVNDPTGVDPTGDVENDPTTTEIGTTGTGTGTGDVATETLGDPVGTTDIDAPTQPAGTDPGVDPVADVGLGLDARATTRVGGRAASAATAADAFGDLEASTDRTPGIGRGQGRRRPRRVPTPDRDEDVFEEDFDLFDARTDTEDVVEPTRGLDAVDDDIMRGFDVT